MINAALFSVPRSGSSWIGEILNSSPEVIYKFQPNFAYSFKNQLTENSTQKEIEVFYKDLLTSNDDFVNGTLSISGKSREFNFIKENPQFLFFKETHYINVVENLLKNSDTKVIGLIRSPFSVINSWINIPKEFNPEWNVSEQWMRGELKNQNKKTHFFGYEKWKEVGFLFLDLLEKYPKQFYLLNYDDLLNNTKTEIKELFKFCGIDFTQQTNNFIDLSTSKQSSDAYAVFKQKDNDLAWQNSLPRFIEDEIKNDSDFKTLNDIFKWI
ncbi:MAG: sulfotransferase domain-containing protein [Psychroflexus halocasei]